MATWRTRKVEDRNVHFRIDEKPRPRIEKTVHYSQFSKDAATKHLHRIADSLPEDETKRDRKVVGELEGEVRSVLERVAETTNVDQMLLALGKYSGTLGDYSPFNSVLISMQDQNATIVRNAHEWKLFGRELKKNANGIVILHPIGIARKGMPGEILHFIQKKRSEGLTDEEIESQIAGRFPNHVHPAHIFGTGKVYDISQTKLNGKPGAPNAEVKFRRASQLYEVLKKVAGQHYKVEEGTITTGALGYTQHTSEGDRIRVMKVPTENVNTLHTLVHELSHARLEHTTSKQPYGINETEAELSAFLVGKHFGFDFDKDSAAYIKGWLRDAKKKTGMALGEESIDRAMNVARWIITQTEANSTDIIVKDTLKHQLETDASVYSPKAFKSGVVSWGGVPVTHIQFLGFTANPDFWDPSKNTHYSAAQLRDLAAVDRRYKGKVWNANRLPKGFRLAGAPGGDFFLAYSDSEVKDVTSFRGPITILRSGKLYSFREKGDKIRNGRELEREYPLPAERERREIAAVV